MPYDDPDATDPMELHAVELETECGAASMEEMAACFVEEYLRLGVSAEQVLRIFSGGEFAGPAMAARHLGMNAIERIVRTHLDRRGRRGPRTPVEHDADGAVRLPVLD